MLEPVPVTDRRQMSACPPFPAAAEYPTPAHLPTDAFLDMRGAQAKESDGPGLASRPCHTTVSEDVLSEGHAVGAQHMWGLKGNSPLAQLPEGEGLCQEPWPCSS